MMAFLLPLLGFGKSLVSAIGRWLGTLSFWQIAFGAVLIFAGIQTVRLKAEQRHSAKIETQLVKCTSARHADQVAYTAAQVAAQAKNAAQVTKVEQLYQRNSDNEKNAYERDLAQLRADRLRQHAAPAPGAPGSAGSSPNSPSGPATDGHGVQVPQAADVQAEDAAEIELRLMHLQNYVAGLLAVDPNKP